MDGKIILTHPASGTIMDGIKMVFFYYFVKKLNHSNIFSSEAFDHLLNMNIFTFSSM